MTSTGHIKFLKWSLVEKYDSQEVRLTVSELARECRISNMMLLMQKSVDVVHITFTHSRHDVCVFLASIDSRLIMLAIV